GWTATRDSRTRSPSPTLNTASRSWSSTRSSSASHQMTRASSPPMALYWRGPGRRVPGVAPPSANGGATGRRSSTPPGPAPPDGRVVVVTGGSAGVGRACVRAFAEHGDDVAVLARGRDGLDAAVKDVDAAGRRGLALDVDVADAAAVEAAAADVERELGSIDV